jgi:hypothetical protein
MQTITKCLVLLALGLNVQLINAQDTIQNPEKQNKISSLLEMKDKIKEEEKAFLKAEVEAINMKLERGEITPQEAEKLKMEVAKKRALNIENRIAIIDNKLELIERNEEDYNPNEELDNSKMGLSIGGEESFASVVINNNKNKPKKFDKRTTDDFVFAIGFNNAIIEGESLNDSPYKFGGSGFVELGYAWKTRVFENSNALRFKYGFSFMWNKLNIKDNLYFNEVDGDVTLEEFPLNVKKSKFRTTNLVFPVHLEFGPSKKIEKGTYYRYSTHKQFKIGIGGYGGFVLQSLQKLKYNEDGNKQKEKLKGYNTNNLLYGISSYVSWGDVGIYVKYDLSPIFNGQLVDQNNISVGLRFDMD